jgi:hypothetical protein
MVPLDPDAGGRSIGQSPLVIADILLSTQDDPIVANTVRRVTDSEVSHASLYIGDGPIVEALLDRGVVINRVKATPRSQRNGGFGAGSRPPFRPSPLLPSMSVA